MFRAPLNALAMPQTQATPVALSEFDRTGLTPEALAFIDSLGAATGDTVLNVNSAYRDPQHNADVGGARNSQHTHGNAFDIDVASWPVDERIALINQARGLGAGGVGVYDNNLHFDVGPTRAWGPDYHAGSVPSWAAEAVGVPRGQPGSPGTTGTVGQPGVNALAQPQGPTPEQMQQARQAQALNALMGTFDRAPIYNYALPNRNTAGVR